MQKKEYDETQEHIDWYEGEIDGLLEAVFDHRNLSPKLGERFVVRFKRLYRPDNEYQDICKGIAKFLYYLDSLD